MPLSTPLAHHYRLLLGLTNRWCITDLTLDIERQELAIMIEWPKGERVPRPTCGHQCAIKDHREERTWRHLDTMQFVMILRCRVPRADCTEHGVHTITVPWGDANARWTLLFERFAIDLMLAVTKTGRAWAIKEAFRTFWTYVYPRVATRFFRRWYYRATHSRLKPMIVVTKTFNRHFAYIVTYFRHGITNAAAESFNAKIQLLKSHARGFRNFDNYRIAILFTRGKLNLYPQ